MTSIQDFIMSKNMEIQSMKIELLEAFKRTQMHPSP